MSFCPKCQEEVPMMALACEHCGYKFASSQALTTQPAGWAYGKLANGSIAISMFICWLYMVLGSLATGYSVFHGQFLEGLGSLISVILAFGLSAVLARAGDMK